jgi:hypothetical protein
MAITVGTGWPSKPSEGETAGGALPPFTDDNVGGGPKAPEYLQTNFPELASKLNGMGEECRKHDLYNPYWDAILGVTPGSGMDPDVDNFVWTTALPVFDALIGVLNAWFDREDLEKRKKGITKAYLGVESSISQEDQLAKFMTESGFPPEEDFYEELDNLKALEVLGLAGIFDRVFTGGGVIEELINAPTGLLCTITALDVVGGTFVDPETDEETEVIGYKQRLDADAVYEGPEWNRVEGEKDTLFDAINDFFETTEVGEFSIKGRLRSDPEFAKVYNRY